MPHFYRTSDEFAAAAQAAVASAAPKHPVAVIVMEVDPIIGEDLPRALSTPESVLAAVMEVVRHLLREDDLVGVDGQQLVAVLAGCRAEESGSAGDRISSAVRMHSFGVGRAAVTLSAGGAAAPDHGTTYSQVLAIARRALARVQQRGRDGAYVAPLGHHEALHRPLALDHVAGRQQEFAALVDLLDAAALSQPRVVTLYGGTGLGTAMLAQLLEAESRVRSGRFFMATLETAEIPEPFGLWITLLRAWDRALAVSKDRWPELAKLMELPSRDERRSVSHYRLMEELVAYLRALTTEELVVLVLDEMQWADAASWDTLEHVLGRMDGERLLVCLTFCTESLEGISPHYKRVVRRDEFLREIGLSRLTRDEVRQWLERVFHGQVVSREFLAFLYRQTEGNPLAINQVLRLLVEDGALWNNGERWEWKAVSELRLPADIPGLINHRLQRFSSSTQAIISAAAVIGREFDVALVVATGAGSEPAVRLALSEALLGGFIHRSRDRRSQSFVFAHREVSEAFIALLGREREIQLRARVAHALERRNGPFGKIAELYDRAGQHREAFDAARHAAHSAERLHVHAAAKVYLELAARNAPTPEDLAAVRVTLAHLAETLGHFDEVEEYCDLTVDWYSNQQDLTRALMLRRMRERARMETGQSGHVTLEALLALDAEAERIGLERERVAILTTVSQLHGRLGDPRTAERVARECVSMAEGIGDPILLADSLNRQGVSMVRDRPEDARALYERALALFEQGSDPRGQARCHNNIGIAAYFQGKPAEAKQAYERAVGVARAAGIPDLWGTAALNLGVLFQRSGDYDRAREQFGEAIELFVSQKSAELQVVALMNMGHAERELGAWEAAAELYEATIPLAQRIGYTDAEVGALAGQGLCLVELARTEDADIVFATLGGHMASRPDWFQGREIVEAFFARWRARNGRIHEALSALETALQLAEPGDFYSAAWLVANCAADISQYDPQWVRESVRKYAPGVETLGYPEMTRRYASLSTV